MKLARLLLLLSLIASQQAFADDDSRRCHWWQFGHCAAEGLPQDAPQAETLITIDVAANKIYLFQDGELVDKSSVATGSEKILRKGKRVWVFHTPRGRMKVLRKIKDPVWKKPDWAYIEEGNPIPPPDSPTRQIKGHLGKYALDLGGGILIHGTDEKHSIGQRVSHGCIRLPNDMLETVWKTTKIGTDVYIYESAYTQTAMSERHSDLDF
jgi:lipoprotein-anchoring transpeptidase ErfK/SrfK